MPQCTRPPALVRIIVASAANWYLGHFSLQHTNISNSLQQRDRLHSECCGGSSVLVPLPCQLEGKSPMVG